MTDLFFGRKNFTSQDLEHRLLLLTVRAEASANQLGLLLPLSLKWFITLSGFTFSILPEFAVLLRYIW